MNNNEKINAYRGSLTLPGFEAIFGQSLSHPLVAALVGRDWLASACILAAAAVFAAPVPAQPAPYPSRPIDLYIGSAPSGSTDALGRVLARSLTGELGQPVVVHNSPGAGGAVMATHLLNSPPDGYSLGMTISHAYTGNPIVSPESTQYAVADFTHLASVSKGQCALITRTSTPYATLADVVEAARNGETPVFASQSPLTRIVADYIAQAENVQFKVITVQGGGEIMQAILGGHADFGFSGGPHVDFVASGQMRVLAAVEDARLITSPDVPTLRELGYDISACSTFVVSAPPGLPPDIVATLAPALERAISSTPMQELIGNLKYPAWYRDSPAITQSLIDESAMLARAVARIEDGFETAQAGDLSPRFMPWVATLLMLTAIVPMLVNRVRRRATGLPSVAPARGTNERIAWRFVATAVVVLLTAFWAMSTLGYIPGAVVIVAGFMALGRASRRAIAICVVAFPVGLWLLFSKLLGFPLP